MCRKCLLFALNRGDARKTLHIDSLSMNASAHVRTHCRTMDEFICPNTIQRSIPVGTVTQSSRALMRGRVFATDHQMKITVNMMVRDALLLARCARQNRQRKFIILCKQREHGRLE